VGVGADPVVVRRDDCRLIEALLSDSRLGGRGGVLPWTLLIVGALASLAANIAVAEPTLIGRVTAAWPSFALTCSY